MAPGKLILVVDDDSDLGTVLVELLESHGLVARIAASVGDALALLDERRPDVVLLDWLLPDGPPVSVAARCRSEGIPVVLSSASSDTRELAGEIGARATLPKPFDVETLYAILDEILRKEEAHPRSYS